MTEAYVDTTHSLKGVQDEAYTRLQLSEHASLSQVVHAIRRRESSRQYFGANTTNDIQEADAIYAASLTRGIQDELAKCFDLTDTSPLEALKTLTGSLRDVQNLPLTEATLARLDETFFDVALETLADKTATPLEKAAGVTLSLQFAAEQRGVNKTQMILEQRLAAEQAARLNHINHASLEAAKERLNAIQGFFDFAGLEFEAQKIDSTVSSSVQKAAELAKNRIERSRQAFEDGSKLGQKVVSVTLLASMGVVGGASMAAASETGTTAEAEIISEAITTNQQALEVPVVAKVEAVTTAEQAAPIETGQTAMVDADGAVVEVDVAAIPVSSVTIESSNASTPTIDAKAAVEATPELTPEEEQARVAAITPGTADSTEPSYVEAKPAIEPEIVDQATQEAVAPATVVAPNSDVNVAVGETPQEAITRIIASRDMNAASYALRKLYSTSPDQPPVNEPLSALISSDVASLRSLISEAAHADPAYTETAYRALAYLDAVTRSPAMLDNPDVAAFVASLSNQGEDYRNKLFAQYLAEAKAALSADTAGAYNGVAEQYRGPIETLYAYTAMAGISDQKQAEQIEAIKAEEARIAAEEEARRRAIEQAQQGATNIEIIASDEKQLVLAAIDRALQQGLITQKYANVSRIVIEQEGPSALVAAAGMVGNCMAEADGCNPVIVERGNGIGFGIFQWSFGRRDTLENTARAQGFDVGDIGFQVRYAIAESKARAQRDDSSLNEWQGLLAQTDAGDAAEFWRWNFERPKDHLNSTNTRIRVAEEVYANITGQMESIRGEAAAAKAAREAEIARQAAEAAERQRQAEEAARAAAAAGDMRSVMPNAKAIREQLEDKYNDVSGQLDSSELIGIPGVYKDGNPMTIHLHPEAAKGYEALAAAFKAHFGRDIRVTDEYRDLAGQRRVFAQKPELAAEPGTSFHGWGMAIDFASDIPVEGSPEHEWMEANAHKFGWTNPRWAHDGKGREEPWHWEFDGSIASFDVNN